MHLEFIKATQKEKSRVFSVTLYSQGFWKGLTLKSKLHSRKYIWKKRSLATKRMIPFFQLMRQMMKVKVVVYPRIKKP